MPAAGLVAHVRRKIKGAIPVNNRRVRLYLRANNQRVRTPPQSRPPPPLYYDLPASSPPPPPLALSLDKLFRLTLSPFSSSCPSLSIWLALIYSTRPCFLRCDPPRLRVLLFIRCRSVCFTSPLALCLSCLRLIGLTLIMNKHLALPHYWVWRNHPSSRSLNLFKTNSQIEFCHDWISSFLND